MLSKVTTVVLTLLLGLSLTSVAAAQGFAITVTVDENGHGTLTNTAGFSSPLPFSMSPDPGPGGLSSAATYGLLNPPGLTAGDLVLLEGGLVSDIIRFNPTPGTLVFYSDTLGDPADSLADTGFPSALYPNSLSVIELGPEGANGFTYIPVTGQPGFVSGAGGPVTYVVTSDAGTVPEPGPLLLVTIGAAVTLFRGRRRR